MDFQSAMETFAEAWVAANTQTPLTEAAETQGLMLSGGCDARKAPLPGRCIPVHCVVEPLGEGAELDDFAIIPGLTPFHDLVRTALTKLGYSPHTPLAAKGAIQLKNWKPLTFEQITESPEATVGDILGELSTVATLRIRLYSRPKPHSTHDVKEKLLQVLLAQSQNLLISSGCPIDQSVLAALTKGRLECDIPDETRKKFDQWYLQQVFQHCRQVALLQQHQQQQPQPHPAILQAAAPCSPPCEPQPAGGRGGAAGRTRIRTSFDPELELPKLHRWFADNQHPSRLQIQQYVRELNSLESRRGRKPLDVNNVVYWFKNARAAHKRAEQKCCPERNGACAGEPGGQRFSGGESHSESQASDNDSDAGHTLDLSVRRRWHEEAEPPPLIKDEPKDSGSEPSLESSESGDEDMAVDRVANGGEPERRKRNRTFIDPVSEVPRLEQWFSASTHPSHGQIVRFTHELNSMQYRQKFPRLEPKNIQFWFKNRRAKCKRLHLAASLQSCADKTPN